MSGMASRRGPHRYRACMYASTGKSNVTFALDTKEHIVNNRMKNNLVYDRLPKYIQISKTLQDRAGGICFQRGVPKISQSSE
jgi:hypothetical protein